MAAFFTDALDGSVALATLFDAAVGSTISFDNGAVLIHQTGTADASKRNLPAGTRTLAFRILFYAPANPSAALNLVRVSTPSSGTTGGILRMATNGRLQALWNGGTAQSSAVGAITLGSWNVLDGLFVTTGTTYTIDARINGVALTQATIADTAHDMATVDLAQSGAATIDYRFAWMSMSVASADYPLPESRPNMPAGGPAFGVMYYGGGLAGARFIPVLGYALESESAEAAGIIKLVHASYASEVEAAEAAGHTVTTPGITFVLGNSPSLA